MFFTKCCPSASKAIPITALHFEPKLRIVTNNPRIRDGIGICLAIAGVVLYNNIKTKVGE